MRSGTLGLLATAILRHRGPEVTTFGLTPSPYLNADLIDRIGAHDISTAEVSIAAAATTYGPFDLIPEGTGSSEVVFEAAQALAGNGILILTSTTAAGKRLEIPADKINLEFVLGNKVIFGSVNANRDYFEAGVRDFSQAELRHPGWLSGLLTHPIGGLEHYDQIIVTLTHGTGVIKVYVEVAPMTDPTNGEHAPAARPGTSGR